IPRVKFENTESIIPLNGLVTEVFSSTYWSMSEGTSWTSSTELGTVCAKTAWPNIAELNALNARTLNPPIAFIFFIGVCEMIKVFKSYNARSSSRLQKFHEFVEKIFGIHRAGRGFRMELYGKEGELVVFDSFNGCVVGVLEPDFPVFGERF